MLKFWKKQWQNKAFIPLKQWGLSSLGISLTVSFGLILLRFLGGLEGWELKSYDQLIRFRLREPKKQVDRITIIKITEADIKMIGHWPPSDAILTKVINILDQYNPSAIGLDIYRDFPVTPGYREWQTLLKKNKRLVAVCKLPDDQNLGVAAPPDINAKQVGFSDVVVDAGGIVRRALIFAKVSGDSLCQSSLSFSFQLANLYLEQRQIKPIVNRDNLLSIEKTIYFPLTPNAGGYQQVDNRGYQLLLDYTYDTVPANSLSLNDILSHRFDPKQIQDRIVLIGITAPSVDDTFYTPFSANQHKNQTMPGVLIHANLIEQLIATASGEKSLLWYWSDIQESLWIILWAMIAGGVSLFPRHPLYYLLGQGILVTLVSGSCIIVFAYGGWIPYIPTVLAIIGTGMGVLIVQFYYSQQERYSIALEVSQQSQDIALLKALLAQSRREDTAVVTAVESSIEHSEITHISNTDIPPEEDITTEILTGGKSIEISSYQLLAGRYSIISSLSSGGFSRTYVARDIHRPGTPCCLVKQLQPNRKDDAFLQVARRLFYAEAKILEKIGHHPQIPRLLAHFEEHQNFYLVEEYILGKTLSDELHEKSSLTEEETRSLLKEILEIVNFVHGYGIIHRDLKPSNLIRSSETEQLVLIDFGAVKEMNQPLSEMTVAIGTRGYASPEQLAGQPNFSSDIYSIGMIGVQALTGHSPDHLPTDPSTGNVIWDENITVSPQFKKVINGMTAYHFRDRYQSIKDVLQDI